MRTGILLVALVALIAISWITTGKPLPTDPDDVLLVQSSVLLVVLATLVSERYFTGPGDAFLNGLTALLTVLPLSTAAPHLPWLMLIGFLGFIVLMSLAALLLQRGSGERVTNPTLARSQRIGFHVSSVIGRARVVYSIVFLTAVVFFIHNRGPLTSSLLVFWGIYLALWPLGIPQFFSRLLDRESSENAILGTLVRVDSPNLARVVLKPESKWKGTEDAVVISWADGSHRWGIPLMSENRADGVLGAVLVGTQAPGAAGFAGEVRSADDATGTFSRADFIGQVSQGKGETILGLVRESSNSTRLRFEGSSILTGQVVR